MFQSLNEWFWGIDIKDNDDIDDIDNIITGEYQNKTPVTLSEGRKLFEEAYKDQPLRKKKLDKIKRKKHVLIPGSPDSYKYRNRRDKNGVIKKGPVAYDLEGVDAGLRVISNEELEKKAAELYHSYEKNYQNYLKATNFWDELQKINDIITNNNYHDIFLLKIVGGENPITEEKRLSKYADVIETAYTLALENKLCNAVHLEKSDGKQKAGSREVITSDYDQYHTQELNNDTTNDATYGFFLF